MSVALLPLTAVGHARHHAGHHARLHRHAGLHALPTVRLLLLHVLLRVHLLRVALRRLAVPRLLLITLLLLTTLLVVALLAVVRPAAVHFWAGSLRLRGGREPVCSEQLAEAQEDGSVRDGRSSMPQGTDASTARFRRSRTR